MNKVKQLNNKMKEFENFKRDFINNYDGIVKTILERSIEEYNRGHLCLCLNALNDEDVKTLKQFRYKVSIGWNYEKCYTVGW